MIIKKAFLILENGTMFTGEAFGSEKTVIGEIVFNTSMTGYLENLSDPASAGQIVLQTFPLIGNYGINDEDFENDKKMIYAAGYIIKEKCDEPSNFRCKGTLEELLIKEDIFGICGIDTRKLTRIISEHGTMKAMLTTDGTLFENAGKALLMLKEYDAGNLAETVSVKEKAEYPVNGSVYNIALVDFGFRKSIREDLYSLKCGITVFPYDIKAEELMGYDGVVIAGGPGSPENYPEAVAEIKKLFDKKIPVLGISIGHNLMFSSFGGNNIKLKQGHRGVNQPVIDKTNGKTYITAQNHGYCADIDGNTAVICEITHINANDKTCEGIRYLGFPALSVQFYPSLDGSVNDTSHVFSRFIGFMDAVDGKKQ